MFDDMEYRKSDLNPVIQRNIKRHEKDLDRTCRKIWSFTNWRGEQYLFGSFCKNWNRLFVTIGIRMDGCFGGFFPQ